MAEALELPHTTYAAYEDPKKFKKPILPFDLTKKIADILESRGVPWRDAMALAGLQPTDLLRLDEGKETLVVSAAVAAGIWREHVEWPPEERYELEVGPNPIPGSERFALRMEGNSMDKIIPPGSSLECARVIFGEVDPVPGDLVIVERHMHDLVEMTCKRLDRDGDEWILRCESTKPEFQEVIRLGRPDADLYIDNETRVTGIVLKAHQDHFRRRMN